MCELRERERGGVRGETGKRYRDERRNEKLVGREVRRRREERWGGVKMRGRRDGVGVKMRGRRDRGGGRNERMEREGEKLK